MIYFPNRKCTRFFGLLGARMPATCLAFFWGILLLQIATAQSSNSPFDNLVRTKVVSVGGGWTAVAVHPKNPRLIFTRSGTSLTLTDICLGSTLWKSELTPLTSEMPELTVSANGRYLATNSFSMHANIFSSETGALLYSIRPQASFRDTPDGMAFDPGENKLLFFYAGSGYIYNIISGQLELQLNGLVVNDVVSGGFLSSGEVAAISQQKGIVRWSLDTPSAPLAFKKATLEQPSPINDGRFFFGQKAFYPTNRDGFVLNLIDVISAQRIQTFVGHARYVTSATLSPTGSYVASLAFDRTVRIWDTDTGKNLASYALTSSFPHLEDQVTGSTVAFLDEESFLVGLNSGEIAAYSSPAHWREFCQ